jgi:hypothetical protein
MLGSANGDEPPRAPQRRTVKTLYATVNPRRQCHPQVVVSAAEILSNITLTRRQNVLALFQAYAERALAAGEAPKGLEQSFAATLQISPSMWSQIKAARPIGDKLARQIEAACGKPGGWLDEVRKGGAPTPAEAEFLELALAAWRSTNSAGRKALRGQMKAMIHSGE